MDDKLDRLRSLLGEEAWVDPDSPELLPQDAVIQQAQSGEPTCYLSTDPEDDEKILSISRTLGADMDPKFIIVPMFEPKLIPYDLEAGELAPAGVKFVPLKALEKFTQTYVEGANRFRVNRIYFDKQKLYTHEWDFFYIYPPPEVSVNASILVPLTQVEHLIWTINSDLKTNLGIPTMEKDPGFVLNCPDDGTPRPRYIGRSNDYETSMFTKKAIPSKAYRPANESVEVTTPSDESLEAFKERMEEILEVEKKKKQAQKAKKQAERHAKQRGWNHEIKRVQRYLGLREARSEVDEWGVKLPVPVVVDTGLGGVEAGLAKLNIKPQFDVSKTVPFPQESSVVFICVDIEAYEKNHKLITEIGIATLDTGDIASLAPEEHASNWFSAIRARHFRITEYKHLNNTEYLQGCADMFRFGTSEWIKLADAPKAVADCFKFPFSDSQAQTEGSVSDYPNKRKIVLVGHDLQADIIFLRQLGYNPANLSNLLECTDTAHMYRAFRREANNSGLGKILADLDIAGWDLHNAGNDAVYTLQAMLAIAVKALVEKQTLREREKEVIERKVQEAVQAAVENVLENKAGWSSGGDDSDGGMPSSPLSQEKTSQMQRASPISYGKENSAANRGGASSRLKTSWRQTPSPNSVPKQEPQDSARLTSSWW